MTWLRGAWDFLWARRKLWLAPIVVMLVIVVALFVVSIGVRIAPTIYGLF
jgi:hypothetical protein